MYYVGQRVFTTDNGKKENIHKRHSKTIIYKKKRTYLTIFHVLNEIILIIKQIDLKHERIYSITLQLETCKITTYSNGIFHYRRPYSNHFNSPYCTTYITIYVFHQTLHI